MKNFVSILTASAALFAVSGAASAADLPSKKAAPAQYVKICDAYGAGFFYIPGGDTCLKIGGIVRAEYRYRTHALAADNASFFRARAYMSLDARTKTSYGDLRGYIQYRLTDDTGQASNPQAYIANAYIEWAGITAGRRANSFFDFYAHDQEWIGLTTSSDQTADVLAYTAKFGGGFSATLSMENAVWREQANVGTVLGPKTNGAGTPSIGLNNIGYNVAGARLPDFIGRLRVDQDWGSAQLTAAFHQNNAIAAAGTMGTLNQNFPTPLT